MKKTISSILLIILILSCVFFSGCKNKTTSGEPVGGITEVPLATQNPRTTQVTVYYMDKNGYIVPVQTSIDWSEGIAKSGNSQNDEHPRTAAAACDNGLGVFDAARSRYQWH